jgi:hypothetical protein
MLIFFKLLLSFNATFNNILVISRRSFLFVEKIINLPDVTYKPSYIKWCLYRGDINWLHPNTPWYRRHDFGAKLGKPEVKLAFILMFKPHTHKLNILRHCTNIVSALQSVFTKTKYIGRLSLHLNFCCITFIFR